MEVEIHRESIFLLAAGVELAYGLENRRWRDIRIEHRKIVGIGYRNRRQRLRAREELLMIL
jgi:lipoate-protein ligase A